MELFYNYFLHIRLFHYEQTDLLKLIDYTSLGLFYQVLHFVVMDQPYIVLDRDYAELNFLDDIVLLQYLELKK
jgi:hypothetical protein